MSVSDIAYNVFDTVIRPDQGKSAAPDKLNRPLPDKIVGHTSDGTEVHFAIWDRVVGDFKLTRHLTVIGLSDCIGNVANVFARRSIMTDVASMDAYDPIREMIAEVESHMPAAMEQLAERLRPSAA